MRSKSSFIVCVATIFCVVDHCSAFNNRVTREVSVKNESVSDILDFVFSQGDRWLGREKKVVLVLGITRVGKSTLVTLLTNSSSLVATGTPPDLVLEDNNRISGGNSTKSTTFVPELVRDTTNNISYYDCPGFVDNRGLKYELSQTYFIRRIFDHVESLKFLFLVDYSSVTRTSSTSNFDTMAKYATSIVHALDKYGDGMAMITTKVPNVLGPDAKMIGDEQMRENVVTYLNIKRKEAIEAPSVGNDALVKLIDVFLQKKDGKYHRIVLVRVPLGPGPIKDDAVMKNVPGVLLKAINDDIKYVKSNLSDFGSTISEKYLFDIRNHFDQINENLTHNLEKVNRDIIKFYFDEEADLIDIYDARLLMQYGYKNLSQIKESSESGKFIDQVKKAMHTLGISVSGENLKNVLRDVKNSKVLSFLSSYRPPMQPKFSIEIVLTYLSDSLNFYTFLTHLYDGLSGYAAQNKVNELSEISKQILAQLPERQITEMVGKINLKQFVEAIGDELVKSQYINIEEKLINSVQLEALHDVVNQMMRHEISRKCGIDNSTLTVTGQFVKISDVIQSDCWENATDIRVFASDTVFIDKDMDKSGKSARVSFIAPKWRTIGQRNINLKGKSAGKHQNSAGNGTQDGITSGNNGTIGLTGGPAGHFFGIGRDFDFGSLEINAIGGDGGVGQEGGKGADGKDPEELLTGVYYDEDAHSTWLKKGYEVEYLSSPDLVVTNMYGVRIRSKNPPGKGGDGGKGGLGGLGGAVHIIGLVQSPSIKVNNSTGATGPPGIGGSGGKGAIASINYYIRAKKTRPFYVWGPDGRTPEGYQPQGESGIDGNSSVGKPETQKTNEPINRARMVVDYKSETLPHIVGSIVETAFKKFYMQLSEIGDIRTSYDPLIFIDEFVTLEKHYIPLRGNLSFNPFFESLLHRIEAFEKAQGERVKNKTIFSYLYSAVYSAICTVRKNYNRALVVDLPEFMDQLTEQVQKVNAANSKATVYHQRDEYKSELDKKIALARNLIETEVMPAIEAVHDDIDKQLDELIEENRQKQKDQKDAIEAKKKEMRELQGMMGLRAALMPVRIFGSLLSLAGPAGAAAGTAVNAITGLAEKIAEGKTTSSEWRKYASASLLKTIDKIGGLYESKAELLKKQLDEMNEEITGKLAENPNSKHLKDVADKLKEVLSSIEEKSDLEIGLDDKKIRGKFKEFLGDKIKDVEHEEGDKPSEGDKKEKNSKIGAILGKAKDIIGVVDVTLDQFEAMKNDKEQMKDVADAIESMERDLKALRQHEKVISSVMMPTIMRIKRNITESNPDKEGGVDASVENWKLQNSIRDTKFMFEKLSDGFSVQRDLEESFNKIVNGMAFLANIYDRIDSYSETGNFADYIAKINLGKPNFGNDSLNTAVAKLEDVIQSNIMIELHGTAIHAIKQHYFPFAHIFLNRFNLPRELQVNDTDSIKREAIKQISQLKSDIILRNITLTDDKYAKYLDHLGTQPNLSLHTWQAESIKNEIKKLFRGEEIVLSAEIGRGRNYDAIKFRNIGWHFVAREQDDQQAFSDALENFVINFKMIGDSYYRCGSRFYIIPTLDREIAYSFRKRSDGSPKYQGGPYGNINANNYFLSPYTMWSIRLSRFHDVEKDFAPLAPFLDNDMDLELDGDVQYLREFPEEYCNRYVDKYYTLDSTLMIE